MDLARLRQEVCYVNQMLLRSGLVSMHSGNASGLDRTSGRLVIKPSGVDYEQLRPEDLVEVDLTTGQAVGGQFRPSVDLPHHLFLYRHLPDIGAVIHTHSPYATAFAAVGRPIPMCLTAMADQFGAEIPCTPYVDNQEDHIGQAILKYRNQAPAILLGNHGVFVWGPTPREALKSAVMLEEIAKTVFFAMQLGQPQLLPPQEVAKWFIRYHTTYGQQKPLES
ncbi:MAG: L-ribulose-5-phosphate 4-epimerase [Thermoguttaceae bacterium]|nr:L-ribulose-5-phosphate 4-epimerase [Thermoguttaceae bacterium]MDW8038820.1 L-ribulose-5-phosphate 4-epimerase [Thermoguttaceae bacterium]